MSRTAEMSPFEGGQLGVCGPARPKLVWIGVCGALVWRRASLGKLEEEKAQKVGPFPLKGEQ